MDLFQEHFGNHVIVEKSGLAVGYLVLDRDPEMGGDRFGWRKSLPVRDHRILDPCEIVGVVHMPHEIDIGCRDGNAVLMLLTHPIIVGFVCDVAKSKAVLVRKRSSTAAAVRRTPLFRHP